MTPSVANVTDVRCTLCEMGEGVCIVMVDHPAHDLVTLVCVERGELVMTLREYAEDALAGLLPMAPVGHTRLALALMK